MSLFFENIQSFSRFIIRDLRGNNFRYQTQMHSSENISAVLKNLSISFRSTISDHPNDFCLLQSLQLWKLLWNAKSLTVAMSGDVTAAKRKYRCTTERFDVPLKNVRKTFWLTWSFVKSQITWQASKHLTINKTPNVLVIHLKRFAYGCSTGKINKKIEFGEFLDVPCSEEASSSCRYNLIGIIVHHGGSIHSGHYIAFVKVRCLLFL